MSQIDEKSPKHCAKRGLNLRNFDKLYKKFFFLFFTLFISILSLILLVWLILHPAKPEFSLKQAEIYQLNLSDHLLLNSSIQITFLSKNPNQKVGIYYDSLQAYASYKAQQITHHASLPAFYQGHQDTNLLAASLAGTGLPVAPSFGYEVGQDRIAGELTLDLKLNGRIRWKVGTWVSNGYHLNVNCVAIMAFGPAIPSGPLSTKQGTLCSTDV